MGGGHYGPPYHESVCRCRMVRAMLTKLPDFVPFHICQVPESQFWRLFFKKLKKIDVENFWGSSSIRRKSENFDFFCFFSNKPYFFKLNLNCTCSQLSFEVHLKLKILKFSTIISIEICRPLATKQRDLKNVPRLSFGLF